jgi:hypothetical protein
MKEEDQLSWKDIVLGILIALLFILLSMGRMWIKVYI